jgi:hypothetical protein
MLDPVLVALGPVRAELAKGGVFYKNLFAWAQRMQGHREGVFSDLVQALATAPTTETKEA